MWNFLGGLLGGGSSLGGLSGIGGLLGGIGSAYSAYKQDKLNRKVQNLNISLLNDERARRNRADNSLNTAWLNSSYAKEDRSNGLV